MAITKHSRAGMPTEKADVARDGETLCRQAARFSLFTCRRAKDHAGRHEASGIGGILLASWPGDGK